MGIAFSTIGGQKYLFPGWIPVEDHISFDDVEVTNPYANIKKRNISSYRFNRE
jgi:hypothetical protein